MESKLFSTLEYLLSALAGVVRRVESLRGRMSPSGMTSEAGRQACPAKPPQGERSRRVEGLFESILTEALEL